LNGFGLDFGLVSFQFLFFSIFLGLYSHSNAGLMNWLWKIELKKAF